jgi:hypothetical protein
MDYYDHGGRNGVWVWPRRAGKDFVALHQTNKMAHQRKGMYWHCLPTYSQARKAVWNNFTDEGTRTLRAIFPKEIVKHPDDFRPQAEMLIELKCGSMIQLVGSDSIDNIVGAGPLHVTFSEYALCKPNSYDLVRPMLRQNGGTASFITTPRGRNHAYRQYMLAQTTPGWIADHKTIHQLGLTFRSNANPDTWIDAEQMMAEERAGGMQPELVRQEYLCDWEAALVGSVYGDLMEALEKTGRMVAFDHDKIAFVNWDLGINDCTALWFWSIGPEGVEIFDHYENHGKAMPFYFDVVEQKCYEHKVQLRKQYLPHDARARSLQTGMSVIDQFWERFGHADVEIAPSMSLLDGVQAGRKLLYEGIKIHPRCGNGIEALKQYHYEFDEKRKTYTNRPEHDWSSHTADAFRYLACVVKAGNILKNTRPRVQRTMEEALAFASKVTLDEMFDDYARNRRKSGSRIM